MILTYVRPASKLQPTSMSLLTILNPCINLAIGDRATLYNVHIRGEVAGLESSCTRDSDKE